MPIRIVNDIAELVNNDFSKYVVETILETNFKEIGITLDPEEITKFVRSFIEEDHKICIIDEEDGRVVALLLAEYGKFNFSKDLVANQTFVRVNEEYRGRNIYREMFNVFFKWAKERGCIIVTAGVHDYTTIDQDKVRASFEWMGFKLFSVDYFIEVKNVRW